MSVFLSFVPVFCFLFSIFSKQVRAVLSGHRSTLIAYGVAESGKSYTLWGTEQDKGLVPRALEFLFAHAPAGSRVTLSLLGLDDSTVVDYLGEQTPVANPQFRDLLDGSKVRLETFRIAFLTCKRAWRAARLRWRRARRRRGTRCWRG